MATNNGNTFNDPNDPNHTHPNDHNNDGHFDEGLALGKVGKTKFSSVYVPENLKYADEEQGLDSLYTKIVDLFNCTLNGTIDPNFNYLTQVDELFEYWDVLRKPYVGKVQALLDPYGISDLVTNNQADAGRLMYYISNIYAIKGTLKALRWVLKLVGMDADVVRWYEPEYNKYRPVGESCYSVIKIYVGNNPVTDEMIDVFNKLMDLLLDVCSTISAWVYVKNLTDDVDMIEGIVNGYTGSLKTEQDYQDYYSRCSMEINRRAGDDRSKFGQPGNTVGGNGEILDASGDAIFEDGYLGVHAFPQREFVWAIVGRYERPVLYRPLVPRNQPPDVDTSLPCTLIFDSEFTHVTGNSHLPEYIGYRDNLAMLVHIADPVIRHTKEGDAESALLKFDGVYRHDQLMRLPENYYDRCHKKLHPRDRTPQYDSLGNEIPFDEVGFALGSHNAYPHLSELDGELPGTPISTLGPKTKALPTFSGKREPSPWFTNTGVNGELFGLGVTPLSTKICDRDPDAISMRTGELSEQLRFTHPHDLSIGHNGAYKHPLGIYVTAHNSVAAEFVEDIPNEDVTFDGPTEHVSEDFRLSIHGVSAHNGARYHSKSEEYDHFFHTGDWFHNPISHKMVQEVAREQVQITGGIYHIREDVEYEPWPIAAIDYPTPPAVPLPGSDRGVVYKNTRHTGNTVHHASQIYHKVFEERRKWKLDFGGFELLSKPWHDSSVTHNGGIDHSIFHTRHTDPSIILFVPDDLLYHVDTFSLEEQYRTDQVVELLFDGRVVDSLAVDSYFANLPTVLDSETVTQIEALVEQLIIHQETPPALHRATITNNGNSSFSLPERKLGIYDLAFGTAVDRLTDDVAASTDTQNHVANTGFIDVAANFSLAHNSLLSHSLNFSHNLDRYDAVEVKVKEYDSFGNYQWLQPGSPEMLAGL